MNNFKMKLIYTCPYETIEDRRAVRELQNELYQKWEIVSVYSTNPWGEVDVVAEKPLNK